MSKRQSGFTRVEIALVMMIAGLVLGAALKGQQIINSAKVQAPATVSAAA